MFEPERPTMMSKLTAPAASFAIASSAELYVAIFDLDSVPLLETLEYDRVEIVGVVVDA